MKSKILGIAALIIFLGACNNATADKKDTPGNTEQTTVSKEDTTSNNPSKVEATSSTASTKKILADYLKLKNSFAKDNSNGAAIAAAEMKVSLADFNKAALSASQAKIYSDIEDDAKEHAEHIEANGSDIKHQREHFEMLSKDVYQLVKSFGSEQTLYYDYCPMYNKGKGGNWISESKVISNPYLGKAMPTCGTVKEELK